MFYYAFLSQNTRLTVETATLSHTSCATILIIQNQRVISLLGDTWSRPRSPTIITMGLIRSVNLPPSASDFCLPLLFFPHLLIKRQVKYQIGIRLLNKRQVKYYKFIYFEFLINYLLRSVKFVNSFSRYSDIEKSSYVFGHDIYVGICLERERREIRQKFKLIAFSLKVSICMLFSIIYTLCQSINSLTNKRLRYTFYSSQAWWGWHMGRNHFSRF